MIAISSIEGEPSRSRVSCPAVAGATFTGVPSVRADKSPRITCSVPSIGVQGTESLGRFRRYRRPAIGDLDPFLVTDPRLEFRPDRLAALIEPAKGLFTAIRQRVERQRPDVGTVDDQLDIRIHPGQELAVGVGQIDLGAKRAALHVEAQAMRVTVAGSSLVAERPGEHRCPGPNLDVVGVPFRDVDEDPNDVEAVDHVNRRGVAAG